MRDQKIVMFSCTFFLLSGSQSEVLKPSVLPGNSSEMQITGSQPRSTDLETGEGRGAARAQQQI